MKWLQLCIIPVHIMHIGDGKGEIEISREFKEQVVEPILKVTVCVLKGRHPSHSSDC